MYSSINKDKGGNEGSGVIQDLGTGVVYYLGTGPKAFISVVQFLGSFPCSLEHSTPASIISNKRKPS